MGMLAQRSTCISVKSSLHKLLFTIYRQGQYYCIVVLSVLMYYYIAVWMYCRIHIGIPCIAVLLYCSILSIGLRAGAMSPYWLLPSFLPSFLRIQILRYLCIHGVCKAIYDIGTFVARCHCMIWNPLIEVHIFCAVSSL